MNNMNDFPNYNYSQNINVDNNFSLDDLSFDILNNSNLNGTNLNDLGDQEINNKNIEENASLIKSLTKEIINNLKENNLNLSDAITLKSYSNTNDSVDCKENIKKKSNKKVKNIKENFQEMIENQNPIPGTNGYIKWIFNEYINLKDFLILFAIYFLLSQEMIKDFFARYFSSLNPDSEGKINIQGVIIYGLILTICYMIAIKLF